MKAGKSRLMGVEGNDILTSEGFHQFKLQARYYLVGCNPQHSTVKITGQSGPEKYVSDEFQKGRVFSPTPLLPLSQRHLPRDLVQLPFFSAEAKTH